MYSGYNNGLKSNSLQLNNEEITPLKPLTNFDDPSILYIFNANIGDTLYYNYNNNGGGIMKNHVYLYK